MTRLWRSVGQGDRNASGLARQASVVAMMAAGLGGLVGLATLLITPNTTALPIVFVCAFASGVLSLVALVFARLAQLDQHQTITEPAQTAKDQPDPHTGPWLTLTPAGAVSHGQSSTQNVARFDDGEKVFDRIHVADRVIWMQALSQAQDGSSGAVTVDVRLNTAKQDRPQGFVAVRLVLWRCRPDAIAMVIAPIAQHQAGADERSGAGASDLDALAGGTHLAMVGHELRTPLNAIIGFSELLRGDAAVTLPAERQREYVGLIHGAATHLLSIVNAMLDVSKIGAGRYVINRESFDLRATVAEVADMVMPRAAEKRIHLNLHLDHLSGNAFADRRAIKQILINLVSNAVKFTPDQGCITLEAETDAQALVLTVADTGIGIEADDLHRLGQPFQQVDNSYTRQCEGTGLGLSLVKGLVGLHGGSFQMDSTPDVGTCVTVRIPFNDVQGADASSAPGAPIVAISAARPPADQEQNEGNENASRRYG